MADSRINLLTSASSSANDDFFVVDGTTNGTRKLNAFSPTFGGNATVTGTLSSAGNLSVTGTSAQIILGQSSGSALTYLIRPAQAGGAIQIVQDSATVTRWLSLGGCDNLGVYSELMRVAGATGNILVTSTVASTTTSTGALVVGNGTSGGLGVGGAINAGSYLRSINSAAANDTEFTALRADVGADGTLGAAVVAIGSLPSATGASRYGFITCSDNVDWRKLYIGGRPGLAASGGQVLIPSTASSTSTSSGALVVSGGVGVAGALNCGGLFDFAVSANSTQVYTIQNTSTGVSAATRLTFVGGASSGNIQLYGSGHSTPNILQYASPSSHAWQCNGVERATLSSAGALTVSSSLTTGAPSGGTAAAWKLGTVATVSPTSPNRTIEVDIGGTIYYIHAKTTNN